MSSPYRELFKLYDLIQNGDVRSVETYLSENEVPINLVLPGKSIGVLHLAVGIDPLNKSKKCTELLLEKGADPNLCNDDGVTPVHISAIWGRIDNLKILIANGGEPSLRDLDGYSSFDYAAREHQWEIYDYLDSDVPELTDDQDESCTYSLKLEKVSLTTDHFVAEYEPLQDLPAGANRKSEIIQEWCRKNSLVVNKLYPTILGETFLIDTSDSKNLNIADPNITLDLTKNDSFRTCMTKKSSDIEISGIKPLDSTKDDRRLSVYEHFSLPGSPKSIVHKNYKSKTSLKSQRTTDKSLDKAFAVAQNRTNEWLSSCSEVSVRSSSSGVSSGGSILVASLQEHYRYEDEKAGVVLLETRFRVSPIVFSVDEDDPDETVASVASALPSSVLYDDRTLRKELTRLGCRPGPINTTTRPLYLKKLKSFQEAFANLSIGPRTPLTSPKQGLITDFNGVVEDTLKSDEWLSKMGEYAEMDEILSKQFDQNGNWREGNSKTSFNYLLLDPTLTENFTRKNLDKSQSWRLFLKAIFYVGKGKQSRTHQHLHQAAKVFSEKSSPPNPKIRRIIDIWDTGVGVICHYTFHNIKPAQAFTYEAAMIDVLGLSRLTNQMSGTYYGEAADWPKKQKLNFGLYLLRKAMDVLLLEGERQIRPADL